MDDSDETVCDDVDDPIILSESQMSPSIIAPIPRSDNLHKKALAQSESETTGDIHDSPEYPPPSAKIKRLASKETPCLDEGCSKSSVCHELLNSQAVKTASKEMTAAEKLSLIREQEEKIEQMLVSLESSVKRGMAPKGNPIFVQVKHLMMTVKTQLDDFTHYQQQQRQEITNSSNGGQDSEDGSSSQWTSQTKHKLLTLAAQQKELLTLLHRHKNLVDKIQALKKKTRSAIKHIIPEVEVHRKSEKDVNKQREIMDRNTQPSLPNTLSSSNTNPLAVTCANIIPNIETRQGNDLSVSRHTSIPHMNVPSNYTEKSCSAIPSQPSVNSAVTQVTALGTNPVLISHTPSSAVSHLSSATMTTPSCVSQPRVQNVVLTAGQLYQVGQRQIYVLPQGLPVTSLFAVTQATQPKQVTSKLPSTTYTTSATMEMGLVPSLSVTKSSQCHTLNTEVTLPTTEVSKQGQISQSSSQVTNIHTDVPSSSVTHLSNLDYTSHRNTLEPVSAARTVNNSLALQNAAPPIACDSESHENKQGSHSNNKAPISCATSESAQAVPQLHKSTMLQLQHIIPTHNATGVQSLPQAAMTTEPAASKGVVVQSRSLQRRGSFGNDLPDVKSLLNHNVIQAGPNVLSMQYEVQINIIAITTKVLKNSYQGYGVGKNTAMKGRNFEASLRSNGLIESAGGETFRTPMAWMKAVTGSWNNVKQSHAYKMVCYKGRPLALFTIPSTDKGTETWENRGKDNVSSATKTAKEGAGSNELPCKGGQIKTSKAGGLLTCWEDVARLLSDCKVIPIGKDELIPMDSFLPANFWDSTNDVDIPPSVLEELDF